METYNLPEFMFGNYSRCAYCGDPAVDKDHVIPVSYQHSYRDSEHTINGPKVWACRDCNSHLNNRHFDSFKARCEWASGRINRKVKPVEWHAWELMPMDYGLRNYIVRENNRRKWLRQRSDFYGSREFYLNLESLTWEVRDLGSGPGSKFLKNYFASIVQDILTIYRAAA